MTKTPCSHLEALLPQLTDGGIGRERRVQFEVAKEYDRVEHVAHLKHAESVGQALAEAGLSRLEVEIAIDRFVSKMTLDEIAERHGLPGAQGVHRFINETVLPQLRANKQVLLETLFDKDDQ